MNKQLNELYHQLDNLKQLEHQKSHHGRISSQRFEKQQEIDSVYQRISVLCQQQAELSEIK
ncbi:hypothetical protein [Dongshaea marina]|uniref:hypothetical protein n=1 Tax=Dongshaea marina TaxID=2047966 RepID=UPI000D3E7887|nr:hypothetical protein [Dongshaea marina]